MKTSISLERLKHLLHYDPETGVFKWIARSSPASRVKIGGVAGTKNNYGYIIIKVDDVDYRAHRLAWLYMTGEWATCDVDHEDTDRANNRWKNLRLATRPQNVANSKLMSTNTTGFKGVSPGQKTKKFKSQIRLEGRVIYLGLFETAEEAHLAYRKAALAHYGEFARFE